MAAGEGREAGATGVTGGGSAAGAGIGRATGNTGGGAA